MNILAIIFFFTAVFAKNILLSNDDSWASTNIRATYRDLKEAGHTVILVAPVSQRSGWSGKFDVPYTKDLLTNGEFNYRIKGDPVFGHEDDDMNIWYFNGTPASSVSFGLNHIIPKYFNNLTIDLVVAGPNEGPNDGPGYFTISGTMGATYNAVYRGVPAIAVSGSNGNNSFFKDSLDDDPMNPANIYAKKVVDITNKLFDGVPKGQKVLPIGIGLGINLPKVGYESENEACNDPNWVYTRVSGLEASTLNAVYNETSGLVESEDINPYALTVCYTGDCGLPSESNVLDNWNCSATVSAFQVDYSANKQSSDYIKGVLEL